MHEYVCMSQTSRVLDQELAQKTPECMFNRYYQVGPRSETPHSSLHSMNCILCSPCICQETLNPRGFELNLEQIDLISQTELPQVMSHIPAIDK